MSAYPSIKLTYFNGTGRAESIRLAMHIAGIPFEDNRLSPEEFAAQKSSLPFGQLPILEVDGQVYGQSAAQLKYVGRLGGLYPVNNPIASVLVAEIMAAVNDAINSLRPAMAESDPEKKKEKFQELAKEQFPSQLSLMDKRLHKMYKLEIFQTEQVFIHELMVYSLHNTLASGYLSGIPPTIVDGYESFQLAHKKVASHPKVIQWNAVQRSEYPKLKLTYFGIPGKAESIRLAFAIGGIPFEDARVDPADWPQMKPTLPYQQLPVLEVNDDVMCQSNALLNYAGMLAGLYPENEPVIQLRADEIDEVIGDFHFGRKSSSESLSDVWAKTLKLLENRINHWGTQYAVSDRLTTADLAIYGCIKFMLCGFLKDAPTTMHENYPKVFQIFKQVDEHPKVVEWYQNKQ